MIEKYEWDEKIKNSGGKNFLVDKLVPSKVGGLTNNSNNSFQHKHDLFSLFIVTRGPRSKSEFLEYWLLRRRLFEISFLKSTRRLNRYSIDLRYGGGRKGKYKRSISKGH